MEITQIKKHKKTARTPEQLNAEIDLRKSDPVKWRANKLAELAARRVPNAIKRIRQCGNLAAYKPTEAQAVAICDTMQTALNSVRLKLRGQRDAQQTFNLPA